MALTQLFSAFTKPTATKLNESSIPVVSNPTTDISNPYVGQIVFSTTDTRLYRCSAVVSGVGTWRVFSGGPTWALTRITTQSIPNATWTTLNWTVEVVDTGGVHAANADTVVVNQSGLYTFTGRYGAIAHATGARGCRLTLNGTSNADVIPGSNAPFSIGNNGGFPQAAITPAVYVQLAVNDVLRVQAYQNSGAALNTAITDPGDQPLFTGTWLRD